KSVVRRGRRLGAIELAQSLIARREIAGGARRVDRLFERPGRAADRVQAVAPGDAVQAMRLGRRRVEERGARVAARFEGRGAKARDARPELGDELGAKLREGALELVVLA